MLNKNVFNMLLDVDALKAEYSADGVKIYFKSMTEYTIKVIKDNNIIRTIRKGHKGQFDKSHKPVYTSTTK